MIDEIESEDIYGFLEHHGVRGMRWGVRKARSSGSTPSKKPKTPKTPAEKSARNKKILGIAMLGVGGALFVKMIIDQHKTMKARDAAKIYNAKKNIRTAQKVNDIISMNTGVRMSEVRTGFQVGKTQTVRSGFKVGKSGAAEPIMTTKAVVDALKDPKHVWHI
jgi:hypothetical protein